MRKITTNFEKTLEVYKQRKKLIVTIILVLTVLFPFYISIRDVIIDSIPFWFDPARDLLLAWDNLTKITLIGPPSGIPGIFYGPYWIWFLSFGLLFSKDPRVVTAFIFTIPYFTILPYLLFRFTKIFSIKIIVLLWLFFIFAYKTYTTYIWNPHLAPLFLLIVIYLLIFTPFDKSRKIVYLRLALAGIFAGLLTNVHISFGVVIMISSLVFLIVEYFLATPRTKLKVHLGNRLVLIVSFLFGLFIPFLPNLIFEIRHGFNQTQALVHTITNALLYHSSVVGYVGLSKSEIMNEFLASWGRFLSAPEKISHLVYIAIVVLLIIKYKSYLTGFGKLGRKLLVFLVIAILAMLVIYLNSKNPVWVYHFIGSEVLILLFLALILSRSKLATNLLSLWLIYLVILNIYQLTKPSEVQSFKFSNLATKKHIADIIYKDTANQPFSISVYSTAIYTFDYDYIFRWYGTEKYPGQIPQEIEKVKYVYLIIPRIEEAYKADFIDYKTPNEKFKTINEWRIPDGTTILKREKLTL